MILSKLLDIIGENDVVKIYDKDKFELYKGESNEVPKELVHRCVSTVHLEDYRVYVRIK